MTHEMRVPKIPQAEPGNGKANGHRQWLKRWKARAERRRARRNPEVPPSYRKFQGY